MAYITQRPEEEKQLGLGAPGGFAGGGGQGMGGAPQAGVQKGTGGTQPWVNIQNYLQANPSDTSGKALLEKNFGQPLEAEAKSIGSKFDTLNADIGAQQSVLDKAKSDFSSNLGDARTAYSESVRNMSPNIFGGALERAKTAAGTGITAPAAPQERLSTDIQSQFAQLSDPYKYLSTQYGNQGLTQGQRALQEQLTRKSTQLPAITQSLAGKYSQAQTDIDAKNRAGVDAINKLQESQRGQSGELQKQYDDYLAKQTGLASALNDKSNWSQTGLLGNSLPEIGKTIQSYKDTQPGWYSSSQPVYEKALRTLLDRYNF